MTEEKTVPDTAAETAEALEGGLRSLFANQGLTDADFQKLIEGDTATYNKLMDMLSSGGTADLSDGLQQSEIDAAYGFTADDVDTMRDYVSQLIEANQNLQEIRQTVHEQILNVWDEWNEKLDAGIAKIEHLQSITESYQNIIDIVVLLVFSVIVWIFAWTKEKLNRREGIGMLLLYAIYVVYICMR